MLKRSTLKLICVLMALVLMISVISQSVFRVTAQEYQEFKIGENINARLYPDGTMKIVGQGDTFDYSIEKPAPFIEQSDLIINLEIEEGITGIGSYLFYNCSHLTDDLILPSTLIDIKDYAFSGDSYDDSPKFTFIQNDFTTLKVVATASPSTLPTISATQEEEAIPSPMSEQQSVEPTTDVPQATPESSPETSQETGFIFSAVYAEEESAEPTEEVSAEPTEQVSESTVPTDEGIAPMSLESETPEETGSSTLEPTPVESVVPTEVSTPVTSEEATLVPTMTSSPTPSAQTTPVVEESSTPTTYELVEINKQTIGKQIFYPGQAGYYFATEENIDFNKACEDAGYLNAVQMDGIMTLMEGEIWDGSIDTTWYNTTDTSFTIMTASQLAGFGQLCDKGNNFSGKKITLGANIYMNDISTFDSWMTTAPANAKFNPIGGTFSGEFDGAGYTIDGLYVKASGTYQGLFSNLKNAVVHDLNLTHEFVYASGGSAGGIASNTGGGNTVYNITVNGSINAYSNVGGIMQRINAGDVIFNCVNYAKVTATNVATAGGIVGNCIGGTIYNSYNVGNVFATAHYAGGIVASLGSGGKVENCYNVGSVGAAYANQQGSIIGYKQAGTYVSNCYNLNTINIPFVGTGSPEQTNVTNVYSFDNEQVLNNPSSSLLVDELTNYVASSTSGYDLSYWVKDSGDYIFPVFGDSLPYDTSWYADNGVQGDGSEGNPFVLLDVYDYYGFVKIVNGELPLITNVNREQQSTTGIAIDSFANKYISLGNNITINSDVTSNGVLNEGTFEATQAIGSNQDKPFAGTFDGGGYSIYGLYNNSSPQYNGTFGWNTGTIKNLTINDSYFSSSLSTTTMAVGGVAAVNKGTITNCVNYAVLNGQATSAGIYNNGMGTGGIAGYNGGVITYCRNNGNITASTGGGITGSNGQGISGWAKDTGVALNFCTNSGNITGGQYAGGVVGRNWSSNITNSYNSGNISGVIVGGVSANNVGTINAKIVNAYNTGTISSTSYGGGIIGWGANGSVYNVYNIGAISGKTCGSIFGDSGAASSYIYTLNTITPLYGKKTSEPTNHGTFADNSGLLTMVSGTAYGGATNLLGALNNYAYATGDIGGVELSQWTVNADANNGYPIFGDIQSSISNAGITTGLVFNSNIEGTYAETTNNSVVTASWDAEYLANQSSKHSVKFSTSLPAGIKLTLQVSKDGQVEYYYYRSNEEIAANSELLFTSFTKAGTDTAYTEEVDGVVTERIRLAIDGNDVVATGLNTTGIILMIDGAYNSELSYKHTVQESAQANFSITDNIIKANITTSPLITSSTFEKDKTFALVFTVTDSLGNPASFTITNNKTNYASNDNVLGIDVGYGAQIYDGQYLLSINNEKPSETYNVAVAVYKAYDLTSSKNQFKATDTTNLTFTAPSKISVGFSAIPSQRIVTGNSLTLAYNKTNITNTSISVNAYKAIGNGDYASSTTSGFSASINGSNVILNIPDGAKTDDLTTYKLVFTQTQDGVDVSYTTYIILKK